MFGERIHQMLRARAQGGFERAAVDGDRFVNAIAGFGKPVDQTAAVAVERPRDRIGERAEALDDILAAPLQVERQRLAGLAQATARFFHLGGEKPDDGLARAGQLAGNMHAGLRQASDDLVALRGQAEQDALAGLAERGGDFLAFGAEGLRDAHTGVADGFRQLQRRRRERVGEIFVRAGHGAAHLLGVEHDRLALVREIVDQSADATLVIGVGAFERRDFGAYERFEFAGARERALDAVAHRSDLAADRLRQRDHLFGRDRLGLGETHGDLAHGARGQAHLLRSARDDGEQEEEGDGAHERESRHGGLDPRYVAREQHRAIGHGPGEPQAHPDERDHGGGDIGALGRAHLHGLQYLTDRTAVVVGRRRRRRDGASLRGLRLGDLGFGALGLVTLGLAALGVRAFRLRHLERRRRALASWSRAQFVDRDFRKLQWLVRAPRLGRGLRGLLDRAQVQGLFDRRQSCVGRIGGLGLGSHETPLVLATVAAGRIPPACETVNQL